MGVGWASEAWTLPPVPIGPAVAAIFPPIVTFPPSENARTASSLLRTMTKSVMSAPTWRPQPTPAVPMQEGADQDPSGSRAMTSPDPALPEKTNPALITEKIARPAGSYEYESKWPSSGIRSVDKPRARWRTALGIELSAESGLSGSASYTRWSIICQPTSSKGTTIQQGHTQETLQNIGRLFGFARQRETLH